MRTLSVILVLLLVMSVEGAKRAYTTGTLERVDITDLASSVKIPPLTIGGNEMIIALPLGVMYMFSIRSDDLTYVAACDSQKKSYAAEWVIHDPIDFRIAKETLFLKRPNGKELRLALIMTTRNDSTSTQAGPPATHMIPECR